MPVNAKIIAAPPSTKNPEKFRAPRKVLGTQGRKVAVAQFSGQRDTRFLGDFPIGLSIRRQEHIVRPSLQVLSRTEKAARAPNALSQPAQYWPEREQHFPFRWHSFHSIYLWQGALVGCTSSCRQLIHPNG
jgi:hypothetical protein